LEPQAEVSICWCCSHLGNMPTALDGSGVEHLIEGKQPPPQAAAEEDCTD